MSTPKTLVGYCEPFSVAAGERVQLMVSSLVEGPCRLDLARLHCGDPHAGLDEVTLADVGLASGFTARHQPVRPGSYLVFPAHPAVDQLASLDVLLRLRPSRGGGGRTQALLGTWDEASGRGWALYLGPDGAPGLAVGRTSVTTGQPLVPGRWAEVRAGCEGGVLSVQQRSLPSRSPAADLVDAPAEVVGSEAAELEASGRPLLMGAWWGADGHPAAHFDGRLEAPMLTGVASWDFSRGIGTDVVVDTGPLGLHGRTVQCPARAVTGSRWDGSTQRWLDAPGQYAAIHTHHDDLVDAGWTPDVTFEVPADLPSGLYCFRVTGPDDTVDRTPFVVRPPRITGPPASASARSAGSTASPRSAPSPAPGSAPSPAPGSGSGSGPAEVLFLMPTATYLAYANHRMTIEGTDYFPSRSRLRPEFQYLRDHPEVGLSMYEYHPDGSGVMYSSRRRPVLNLRPGADGWAFTADTNLVAFLHRWGRGFDMATDEDLHAEGEALLRRYRVVLTGSHPEYYSTAMLDAVEQYLAGGGRLMYLGGNGFYWRVAFHPDHPGVMEVRRAEDGTRGWIAEPGESYHEWGGEYGGLWRRLGRPPNLLVGVGFAAQGFDRAAPYGRTPASFEGRAAWVFDGIESPEVIGDYGVGRGAAGQEIDRYDRSLGSPVHAVVLATADEHSPQMLRTKEELLATRPVVADPKIRADMVFFETPAGGAVFSVGSIAWYGALGHRGGDNDIARITTNVLDRFVDPTPFEPPN